MRRWLPWVAAISLWASIAAGQETSTAWDLGEDRSLRFGLFTNVDFTALAREEEQSGFSVGAVDLFATANLSSHWSGLVELLFEAVDGELVIDVERIEATWSAGEPLRITAGRLHTSIVRWNIEQHHGMFLQTSIDKPAMTSWEDEPGLWPVHFVGVVASGRPFTGSGFSWEAGVGNGRGERLDEIQTFSDRNGAKAWIASAGWAPPWIRGLDLWLTGYIDEIPSPVGSIDERIVTVSGQWIDHGIELRGEWSRMDHERGGHRDRSTSWYLLGSMRLPGSARAFRPYLLLDRLEPDEDDPYLEGARHEEAWAAGVRWDIDRWVALKTDFRSERIGDAERDELVRIQLALSF